MTLSAGTSTDKHLALLIELPDIYTADIDGLREFKFDDDSESDFLLNCIGAPGIVRVRMEINGEKDSTVVEAWGYVREAQLVEPSRGYETGQPKLTGDQLRDGGYKLMRDDDSCEWCHSEPEDIP
jgi:hypothetical protein